MENNIEKHVAGVSRMEAQAVLDRIRSVIVRKVECEEKHVVLDARWHDDLCADSLDLAEIMMELDRMFEVHINEHDGWERNSTLYEACSGIVRTLRENGRM